MPLLACSGNGGGPSSSKGGTSSAPRKKVAAAEVNSSLDSLGSLSELELESEELSSVPEEDEVEDDSSLGSDLGGEDRQRHFLVGGLAAEARFSMEANIS